MAPVLIMSWLVVVVVVGSYMVLLHPALTGAYVGPDLCALCPNL